MAIRRAVFFDRDGVLNEAIVRDGKPYPPRTLDEVTIANSAAESLARLQSAGFVLLVVTNQPDIGRGVTTTAEVGSINDLLRASLPIDEFLVCPHDDVDACECRKPKPGLLIQGARQFNVELSSSYMVGDRWKDVEAGHQAGCTTIWIDQKYRERCPEHTPVKTVSTLQGGSRLDHDARGETILINLVNSRIKLFADGATLTEMCAMYRNPLIQGFTTNPTLMQKAGISNYASFAHEVLSSIPDRPISFEVFSDDFDEMEKQATKIASWGNNVYVKIPISNTLGESSVPLVQRLSQQGVKLNVTAVMTLEQTERCC